MFTVKTLNKIAAIGTDRLDRKYFTLDDASENPSAIIVRSAKMQDYTMNPELLCIARAGAGYNNIPVDRCAEEGVVVFNTPGANSRGVCELVLCAMLLASRDVVAGVEWARSIADKGDEVAAMVEKGKSAYVGPEILGKTLGVVGLGAVGYKVAKAAFALGMKVVGYDPYLSPAIAEELKGSVEIVDELDALYAVSDYITLHLPATKDTKGMMNAAVFAKCKDGVRLLNMARGELVNDDDVIAALESGKVARYVTDFPNGKTAGAKGVVPIPHLGASTPESEDNCAVMAADQISEYLLRGNIVNSVNLPNVSLERSGAVRIVVIRKADPTALSELFNAVTCNGGAIVGSADKTRGDYSATILDVNGDVSVMHSVLPQVRGVIKVVII